MNISVIGSGWVGTLIGRTFACRNNTVIFFDINKKRIAELNEQDLDATDNISYAVGNTDISFITVPTPEKDDKINLEYIERAIENIGAELKNKQSYHLVVIKSTVIPGTTETVIKNILEKTSNRKVGEHIGLCMNPEFLTQIHNSWIGNDSFKRTPETEERVVIGEYDKKSGDMLEQLYKPFNIPIFRVDLKTAEFIKYAANCCLSTRITFWNEMFLIAREAGIDSNKVAEIVSMDKRIGKYGIVHGKAFGGTCFPKDLKAFVSWAKQYHKTELLQAVDNINEYMRKKYGVRE